MLGIVFINAFAVSASKNKVPEGHMTPSSTIFWINRISAKFPGATGMSPILVAW
jgi:hypothetical protein